MLEALHEVEKDHGDSAEEQHRDAVLGPRHLFALVNAHDAVDEFLDRAQNKVQNRVFPFKDTEKEYPERLGEQKNNEHDISEHENSPSYFKRSQARR
jgi:hypothetical protein